MFKKFLNWINNKTQNDIRDEEVKKEWACPKCGNFRRMSLIQSYCNSHPYCRYEYSEELQNDKNKSTYKCKFYKPINS